jgi:hypothetical protein
MIDPSIAFESCGWFSDPDRKAKISQDFYEKNKKEADEKAKEIALGQFVNNGKGGATPTPKAQGESDDQEEKKVPAGKSQPEVPKPDK